MPRALPTVVTLLAFTVSVRGADSAKESPSAGCVRPIWREEIGSGFTRFTRLAELKFSRGFGTASVGSSQAHHFWFAHAQLGTMLSGTMARDRWYAGNLEGFGLITAGWRHHPDNAYFAGLNLGLRYHFATGTRFVPFIGGSAGISVTDISHPDLNGKFQFNEQFGAGLRYFFDSRNAISLEYAGMHISNGGISRPNNGVNAHLLSVAFSHAF